MSLSKEQQNKDIQNVEIGDNAEYVQYAIDIERTMHKMQKVGSFVVEPRETALSVLKTASEFYDAEWIGIIDIDTEMRVWAPIWWYHQENGEMAQLHLLDGEPIDCLDRWIDCIRNQTPVIIKDTEDVKDSYPEEYTLYLKYGCTAILATPFWQKQTGLFLVKNPKRYKNFISMLHLLNYTVITLLHEYKLMETLKHRTISPRISEDKDVYISVFGELKITTSKGAITETELKSPKIVRLLVYLLLSRKAAISPREIQDAIWPDEECDLPGKNIKGLVYRLQQAFTVISDYRLIESTTNGYRINTSLNIITDIQLFVDKCHSALSTASTGKKMELLRKAVDLYQGDVLASASLEHWLMPTVVNYQCYYIGMLNELMRLFDAEKAYWNIHTYAAKALLIAPANPDVYFWLIHSMAKRGHYEMARSEMKMASTKLIEDDFQDLKERLENDGCFENTNVFCCCHDNGMIKRAMSYNTTVTPL